MLDGPGSGVQPEGIIFVLSGVQPEGKTSTAPGDWLRGLWRRGRIVGAGGLSAGIERPWRIPFISASGQAANRLGRAFGESIWPKSNWGFGLRE